tara:strand:- start:263 stop:1357 length:1095 start_codon:yes stop_codon:yes gene_type:complete
MPSSVTALPHPPVAEGDWQRSLPSVASWPRTAVVAVVLATLVVATREVSLRGAGVEPQMQMQPGLWAWLRHRVRETPDDPTVVLGSSRISFGFDQDEWARLSNSSRPWMLAWPGSCPRPVLHDLANDDSFRGTVLVGVTPVLFFCNPQNPFPMRTREMVRLSHHWGPADEIEQQCRFFVHSRMSIHVQGVASVLTWLRGHLVLPQRSGQMPPYRYVLFAPMDRHGRMRLIKGFENQPELVKTVQNGWLEDHQRNLYQKANPEPLIRQVATDVRTIRRRGGTVVFVRYPSTEWFREDERLRFPRQAFWNRLIEETGCLGVHFEDHVELKDFDCPEWSHLTQEDAIKFTKRLHTIIKREKDRRSSR